MHESSCRLAVDVGRRAVMSSAVCYSSICRSSVNSLAVFSVERRVPVACSSCPVSRHPCRSLYAALRHFKFCGATCGSTPLPAAPRAYFAGSFQVGGMYIGSSSYSREAVAAVSTATCKPYGCSQVTAVHIHSSACGAEAVVELWALRFPYDSSNVPCTR